MLTKSIVEGILYASGGNPIVRECFELCHIINKTDRNWQSIPHLELFYMDYFKRPRFLMVVDKLVHLYIIGDKSKGVTYNIICIDGFNAEHLTIPKGALKQRILSDSKETKALYLPENFNQRIVWINPDYTNNTLPDSCITIFNKTSSRGTIFDKNIKVSLGVDIYSANAPEYTITKDKDDSGLKIDILDNIIAEF